MKKILLIVFALFLVFSVEINSTPSQKSYVKVVYFHGKKRCTTCEKIEKYSQESVKKNFSKQLKSGKVKWAIIDFDKKENKHYLDDFALFNQSLVIIKYENGKQKVWKNCTKIWQLTDDEKKFKKYVKDEVNEYLKEL
jgi:hypothetical protein